MTTTKPYISLIDQIGWLLHEARKQVVSQVNQTMVMTYRTIGQYIVEYEQGGADRAEYGSGLLQKLSDDLTSRFGKGFSVYNLRDMRKFYLTYPKAETLSPESQFTLSRSHYVRLISMKDKSEREFYEYETKLNNRSLRELNRQFDSALYVRITLSRDKKWVLEDNLKKYHDPQKPQDVIKDPYILEFLSLQELPKYSEKDLETAIIDNIQHFLLELWKWFSFVARQKRFSFGSDHFFVDLVFYNRLLQCFVLVDLKIDKLSHQDIGQMQMYINLFDRIEKKEREKPTIWLLLCKEKNDIVVEYTLPENSNIFASQYQLYLPDKEELKKLLNDPEITE